MHSKATVYFVTCLLSCLAGYANATCDVEAKVKRYVESEVGWKMLEPADLSDDDQELWLTHHKDKCPGYVALNFDSKGSDAFGVSLIKRDRGTVLQKLILLTKFGDRLKARTLRRPHNILFTDRLAAFVVWKIPPGRHRDLESGKFHDLKFEGLVYERMESTSTVYFAIPSGELRSITTSD